LSVNPAGLHHVTAIASDPQKNVDFYTQALGLRLIKQTVNFDAPHIWHLYYGDETGSPASILTFSPGLEFKEVRKGPVSQRQPASVSQSSRLAFGGSD
jgi:Lactoylglutathione lyase and related lyases